MPRPNLIQLLSSTTLYYFFFFSCLDEKVNASSFNEPHSHQGVVTPFSPGDPKVSLDNNAKLILSQGKPYQTQVQSGGTGGRGLVVQDINAPPAIVWSRILDYDNYASMVPKTVESKNYNVIQVDSRSAPTKPSNKHNKKTKNDHAKAVEDASSSLSQIIFTRMKVGFPLLKLEFFIKHKYYPELNSLTWTLDYDKLSDFNDSCGYWYVIPHPDDEPNNVQRTRVYYSVEVSMFDWVPKFVVDFMSTKALTDATAWVKKFSELEYAKRGGKSSSASISSVSSSSSSSTTPSSSLTTIASTQDKKKNKKGLFGRIFRNKKKEQDQIRIQKQEEEEEAERIKQQQQQQEEERQKVEDAKKILRLTWIRLGLVSIVTILGIYDFHLWISG